MDTIEKFPQQSFLITYTMGHKHLNTTEHYVHIQEYLKAIITGGKYLTATALTVEQVIPLIE
ncbi:MAG: hypothetical protein ACE14S_11480 [Candidatus Bathyarchaeia archaeon]